MPKALSAVEEGKVQHTPEPWVMRDASDNNDIEIRAAGDNSLVARSWVPDARRIVACVNGCEGIADPSAVKDLLEALRDMLDRFAPDEDGLGEAEIACAARARAAIARAEGRSDA